MVSQLFIFNDIKRFIGFGPLYASMFQTWFSKQKIGGIETSRMTRDILYIIGESGQLRALESLESGGGNIIVVCILCNLCVYTCQCKNFTYIKIINIYLTYGCSI